MGAGHAKLSDDERRAEVARMYWDYKRDNHPEVEDIAPARVSELLRTSPESVNLVDCRTDTERGVSKIAGAMSEAEFGRLRDAGDVAPSVVCYCTIGFRSGKFAKTLRGLQRRDGKPVHVYNLEGSVLGWVHEGLPVVDSTGKPAQRLHVYGSKWDLAPRALETVRFL